MLNLKKLNLFFIFYFTTLVAFSQTKTYCAFDNLGSKYELNLKQGTTSLTYNKYSSSGSLIQSLNGTWDMRNEGVYGDMYKVVANINGNTIKWIVIHDANGNVQELRDESAGRVWSPCVANSIRKNSNIESLNYNERKKSNDDPVFLFPIEIKLKNGKSIKVINVTRSPVDFKKATSDCASINQMLKTTEYRLPSKSEILALYSNRSKYDLPDGYVWTSEKNKEGEFLLIEFSKNGVTEKYFEPYSFIFGKREAIAFFFKGPPASSTNNKKINDWMVKNLDVVRFRNGDSIPQAKTTDEWKLAQKNKTPAWCFYDNNPANGVKFGKLYNWYAVNDPRGLSPSGWHVPSDSEWSALIAALGGMETSGAQMKSKTSWRTKMDFEKPLCSGCGNGSNLTGFNGFAGGSRLGDGRFTGIGEFGNWWTTSISKTTWTTWIWNIGLSYNSKEVSRYEVSFDGAFSVRCIKD
jgi:uncharacterized protein (TIGR02145 family)